MDYCGPRAIPWSFFVGVTSKPVWDQVSRDAALLWRVHDQQVCTSCGTHPDDWDPEQGGHPRAFVATVVSCPGCAAIEAAKTRKKKELDANPTAGVGLRRQVERRRT